MFKLFIFAAIVCAANAGVIGIGGYEHGVVAAPVVKTAVATSYQNGNQISLHPTAVVAHAPVAVAHAPVAVAHTPVAVAHVAHAPIAVAHAPVVVAHAPVGTLGLGIGKLGGLGEWGDIGIKGI